MIVNYNKFEFNEAQYAPVPGQGRQRERVTDENSKVTRARSRSIRCSPRPTRSPRRLAGMGQERGLYFFEQRPIRSTPTWSSSRSRSPTTRGRSAARWSRPRSARAAGSTRLGLWRQLPAGTDGAYRLMANLISLGSAPTPASAAEPRGRNVDRAGQTRRPAARAAADGRSGSRIGVDSAVPESTRDAGVTAMLRARPSPHGVRRQPRPSSAFYGRLPLVGVIGYLLNYEQAPDDVDAKIERPGVRRRHHARPVLAQHRHQRRAPALAVPHGAHPAAAAGEDGALLAQPLRHRLQQGRRHLRRRARHQDDGRAGRRGRRRASRPGAAVPRHGARPLRRSADRGGEGSGDAGVARRPAQRPRRGRRRTSPAS